MKNNIENIKAKILKLAISGKLVKQDSKDESADILYEKIQEEKEKLIKEKKIRRVNLEPIKEEEIPFGIPDSWKWVRLGEINQLINGDRGKNYPNKKALTESGIPFINAGHLDKLDKFEGKNYITTERYEKLSNGKIKLNDIIYCLRGSLGKSTINYNIEKGAIASSLVIIRPYIKELNTKYIYNYLNSILGKEMIKKYDNGTAQPNLSATNLRKFIIPLPPIDEQDRITKKIDELFLLADKMVDSKNNTIDLVDLIEDKILEMAIKGKLVSQDPEEESAEILYEKIQEEKEKLIKEKKIQRVNLEPIKEEEIPFGIPDSWQWVKLEDIASSIPHKKYQIRKKDMIDSGTIPVVSQSQQLIEGYSNLDSKTLTVDDAVIIFGDHTRIIKYIDFNFIVGADGVKIIKPFNGILNEYFYYSMLYNASITENRGYSRHYKYFKEKLIALPPLNEQKRIVRKLDLIMNYTNRLKWKLK